MDSEGMLIFNLLVNSKRQPDPAGQKDQFALTCLERCQCTLLLIRQEKFVFVSPWNSLIPDVLRESVDTFLLTSQTLFLIGKSRCIRISTTTFLSVVLLFLLCMDLAHVLLSHLVTIFLVKLSQDHAAARNQCLIKDSWTSGLRITFCLILIKTEMTDLYIFFCNSHVS